MKTQNFIKRLYMDKSASTAIEYALIVSLVFLVILGAMTLFSDKTKAMFAAIATAITRK